ncbi:hypothetical protein [Devosia naphthalenivorans]|uniref:hypothetical protein n=1 Tax=Devosia naphthalenivorans TaxID=2082392 RepID=UPI0013B053DB|nr:hypothetical protein [Devosia naphthalenivorans]
MTETYPQQPSPDHVVVTPLYASEGVRTPPIRSKGSQIGKIVCPTTNSVIHTESGTEHNAVMCLYADRSIKKVRSQAVRFSYTDREGTERDHILDLRATRDDDYNYGGVVKVADKAESMDLDAFVDLLATQISTEVADELRPLTDEQMPEWQIRKARLFRKVRTERRTSVDDQLRLLAPELTDPITVGELSERLGGGSIAFRPIVRAIFYGTLTHLSNDMIEPGGLVQYSGEVGHDLDAERRVEVSVALQLYKPPAPKAKSASKAAA